MCPRLKIPFSLGFIQAFYSVGLSWSAQCSSGAISLKWERFPVPPAFPSFLLLAVHASWHKAWNGPALHRASGIGVVFGMLLSDVPCGVFPFSLCLGGKDRKELTGSNQQHES